ncbi:MAG: prepilin-type N-terminal cleavage/methylation domain-containing protein [Candidatus Schekmanbacteria bacterium]|nr:MAG: prepilin-type N-terminal cleavage/methylation domain-containing protein [Candidatus Schekmanbacteria bacterium]
MKAVNNLFMIYRKNNKAFTLLELVVAITILSIITSFIYGVYTGSVKTIDKTSAKVEMYDKARLVLDRMAYELASAATSIDEPEPGFSSFFYGADDKTGGVDTDEIEFVARTNKGNYRFNGKPVLTRISYYLDIKRSERKKEKKKRVYTLYRSEDVIFHREDFEKIKEEEFIDNCRGLNFEYRTDRGWIDNWEDDSNSKQQRGKIPKAVKITLVLTDEEDNEVKFSTIVDLPCSR